MSRTWWSFSALRKGRASGRLRVPTFIPCLTVLEDRTLPATLIVGPGGTFATIQAAVNAASPNDTVQVNPGTYTEQVKINTSLTIEGNGAGVFIQAPNSLTTNLGQTALVQIGGGATVNMSNLTLDGPGPSAGIYVVGGATADVTGVTIAHMRNNPLDGVQTGRGILVGSTGQSQVGHAVITNCTITDYQKSGIVTGGTGTTVTITGTTITGVGPTPLLAQNGIQITEGSTGQVSNNTITGNEFTGNNSGPDPTANVQSIGILILGSGSVSGNMVSGNDVGIANNGTATTISGNTAQGNRFEGILLGAGSATVSNNTITGNNIGVAVVAAAGDTTNAQGTILSNNITNNGNGGGTFPGGGIRLLVGSGATTTALATANFNHIVGNSVGLDNTTTATVDATNNFWGSNAGPGGAGSDTVSGPVTFNPWLVLQVTASPTTVLPGGVATVVADLTMNSSGMDTSALGHLPDGIPVLFGTSSATLVPTSGATAAGKAVAQFTAGSLAGPATVSATVDTQTSTTTIIVVGQAELVLTKTVSPVQQLLGFDVTYTFILHNNGPSTATGVTVTDPFPSGLTVIGPNTPSQGTFDPASGVWSVGTLTAGATAILTVTARVDGLGPITNTARAAADQLDPPGNTSDATLTGLRPPSMISKRFFLSGAAATTVGNDPPSAATTTPSASALVSSQSPQTTAPSTVVNALTQNVPSRGSGASMAAVPSGVTNALAGSALAANGSSLSVPPPSTLTSAGVSSGSSSDLPSSADSTAAGPSAAEPEQSSPGVPVSAPTLADAVVAQLSLSPCPAGALPAIPALVWELIDLNKDLSDEDLVSREMRSCLRFRRQDTVEVRTATRFDRTDALAAEGWGLGALLGWAAFREGLPGEDERRRDRSRSKRQALHS